MTISKCGLLVLICVLFSGCTALFSEQEYKLIEQVVSEKHDFSGIIFSIPERASIRKIKLLGEGKVQNIEIFVRDARNQWKSVQNIKRAIEFPFEFSVIANTDAIRIIQRSILGRGRINTAQFYTVVEKE